MFPMGYWGYRLDVMTRSRFHGSRRCDGPIYRKRERRARVKASRRANVRRQQQERAK